MSILLREGRKEDIKKKYSNKYSDEELDFVLNISDLVDLNHKYTDWIFKNDDIDMDFDMYIDTAVYLVKDFDKYQSQMQKKDINQYKTKEDIQYFKSKCIEIREMDVEISSNTIEDDKYVSKKDIKRLHETDC
jgi:hypothetical protein